MVVSVEMDIDGDGEPDLKMRLKLQWIAALKLSGIIGIITAIAAAGL